MCETKNASVKKSYLYIHIKVIDAMLEAKGKKKKKPLN
jgi:hypothetical protein